MNHSKKNHQSDRTVVFSVFLTFFAFIFVYFNWFGKTTLLFQEKQGLFLFQSDFVQEFFKNPGGPFELAGKFLTQFYSNTFVGSILLAIVFSLSGLILLKINKALNHLFFVHFALLPLCALLLMQTHYFHLMEYNLGFLFLLLFFYLLIVPQKSSYRHISLLLFPVFFYLGGAYAFILLGMYITYNITYQKGKYRFVYSILALIIVAVTFIIFKELVFLQPIEYFITYPLPLINVSNHRIIFYLLLGYLLSYPLIIKISAMLKNKQTKSQFITIAFSSVVLSVTILILYQLYDQETIRVLQMEQLVFEEKYEEAIEYHEKKPSQNLIGQYFYNISLSETNQLCERLFYGRQAFKTSSLILPWSNEHLPWGAYFYYTIGLANEAHRWAYEEMIVYGQRPQNIKMLAKTNIINGDYEMAKRYIDILKNTFGYRKWAKEYEQLIIDPALIQNHSELREKRKLLPEKNFFIDIANPQNNLPLLIESNPTNRTAFEYEMAWFLLSKNVIAVVNGVNKMRGLGFKYLPTHVEEAILIYSNSKGAKPDLSGFSVSDETLNRFKNYVATYKTMQKSGSLNKENIRNKFGDTYWFYYHFSQ